MIKTLIATVVTGAFLAAAAPVVHAEDKAPAGAKAEKSKKDKKDDKGAKGDKPAGGGW